MGNFDLIFKLLFPPVSDSSRAYPEVLVFERDYLLLHIRKLEPQGRLQNNSKV